MHLPHAEPRRSIYYRYRVHEAAPRPQVDSVTRMPLASADAPVLIVGAGPIGLVTALGLAAQGVRCVLLEAERQVSEGSRAIVFTRRSMEILQQVGVSEAMLRRGLPWRCGNSHYRGKRVFRMEAPHDADQRFFPMTNLQQQYLEEYLLNAVANQPLIEVRWGHKLTGVLRNEGVENSTDALLEVDTAEGPYRQSADWVVAADGARSVLRQLCGLRLQGAAYKGKFVIADIRVDLPLPTERLAFFDPDWNPGNTVLMHREPEGIWRVDYQLPVGETPEQALEPVSMKARIDAQLAAIGHAGLAWELDWSSVYSARAMTLPDYVHGRIVFAGDAAHLLPIFGVRGANTGLQDAQNLAWKLGLVVRGLAGRGLLASYSQERVAAAREIIDEAGKSTRFMTPPTAGFRLLRDAVLSLSLTQDFVRPLFHWRTARPHEHRDSALNAKRSAVPDDDVQFSAGPADGAVMPNLRLEDGRFVLDLLCGDAAAGFSLWVFEPLLGEAAAKVAAKVALAGMLDEVTAWRVKGLPLQLIAVMGPDAGPADWADQSLADGSGRLRLHLAIGSEPGAYLLRPDQHVCARWLRPSAARLNAAMRCALAIT